MNQKCYLQRLLERVEMQDCKPKYTPNDSSIYILLILLSELTDNKLYREIAESLISAMIATGPDICFIVTKLSQFMSKPYMEHRMLAKCLKIYKGYNGPTISI